MKKFIPLLLFFFCLALFAQEEDYTDVEPAPLVSPDSTAQKKWADSLYNTMSTEEKIGQLFMTDIFTSHSKEDIKAKKKEIEDYHLGGVIFSEGGPVRQANLTNDLQDESAVPLLIGQDAEWGLAMRLDSTFAFPWNMTLGAIADNNLIRKTGKHIAQHAKRLGVRIDFAPDIDININPQNPIIGNRSFGEDRKNVTQKGLAFITGMENQNVLANAKHFPGHGDTDVDSHKELPVLDFSKERLDSIELYPYKHIIPHGVSSIIIGHLDVPVLDSRENHPASLSKPIVTGVLKDKLNYNGLIITDGLRMKGVANYDEPGKTSLDAFLAGNDILLTPRSIKDGFNRILKAYQDDVVSEKRLEHSVKKILMAKYKVGLNDFNPVETKHLADDLNSVQDSLLYAQLMENAITVIQNNQGTLPLKHLDKKRIAYVPLGDADGEAFYNRLQKYDNVQKVKAPSLEATMKKLENFNYVIVGFHKSNKDPWQPYEFSDSERTYLQTIAKHYPTILNVFASPYALLNIKNTGNLNGIVIGYQNSKTAQEKTADILFGSIGAKGKLPVSIGEKFPVGTQIKTESINRLSYGLPESVGIDSDKLQQVDSLAHHAISEKMTPGLQLLVARKGRVILQKSYGSHSYDKDQPVKDEDVYDLASMTKILATLPLLMELEEQGTLQLNTTLGEMLPFLKNTNKAGISLKKALSHYARLKDYIKFYKYTLNDDDEPSSKYYRSQNDSIFSIKVADHMYLRKDYNDTMYKKIAESPLRHKIDYKYSGLPFYLSKKYLESYYGTNLDTLTQNHFYKSLGANHLGYLPLKRFDTTQIAPTEKDDYWRHQTIHGYVHDEAAAMFGGINGNAGLFGNANDVAKMTQMYLNGGTYGGKRYFKSQTIDTFNTCYYCSEGVFRGLGFDKPRFNKYNPGLVFKGISEKSFGHSGFTGTITWADPKEDIVYVLLSNSVHPKRTNAAFKNEGIRAKIQKLVYKAIKTY